MKTIKERAVEMLRRFSQANPRTLAADNAAVDMAALLQELIDAPEPEPVGEAVNFNGWGIVIWKGMESDFQVGTKFYAIPPANNQSEQHLEMVNPPAPSVPVLTVECEPDYWSRGHYHEGTKPYIAPTAVWKLPIGTKLYTSPPAPSVLDSRTLQFLTDVLTAAGLLRHGKKDAGLATRIAEESCRIRQQLFSRQPEQPADSDAYHKLVRDAERYRWLRASIWYVGPDDLYADEAGGLENYQNENFSAENLDTKIDAAIERDKKGGAA